MQHLHCDGKDFVTLPNGPGPLVGPGSYDTGWAGTRIPGGYYSPGSPTESLLSSVRTDTMRLAHNPRAALREKNVFGEQRGPVIPTRVIRVVRPKPVWASEVRPKPVQFGVLQAASPIGAGARGKQLPRNSQRTYLAGATAVRQSHAEDRPALATRHV